MIATIMTNKHQRGLDRDKKKLEKVERAYEILSRIEHIYRMAWGSDIASLQSRTYEDKYRIKEIVPFEELEMLIGFYAPELKHDVDDLITISKVDYGKLSSGVTGVERMPVTDVGDLQGKLNESFMGIKEKISSIQSKLVKLGNKYL